MTAQPTNHFLDPSYRLVYEARPQDMMLWSKQYPFGNEATFNQEIEQYQPGNVFVAPTGELVLEARNIGGGDPSLDGGKYTSGMVASYNCLSFTHGYLEAMIKMPSGLGVWPAFWMLYTTVAAINEIDIVELFESPTSLNSGLHFPALTMGGPTHDGGPTTVPNLSAGYHAFAVDWEPLYVQFYFDGAPTLRITNTAEIPTQLMYILMNIAISGVAVNDDVPLDSQFPIDLRCQYVRLWQGFGSQYQLVRSVTPNYGSYNSAVSLDGAVAHYPLNETSGTTAHDVINGNNAAITGGVMLGQTPITSDNSTSMLFDGSTGYVALPTSVNPSGWYAFSAEIWFLYSAAHDSGGRLFDNAHTDQTNQGFQLALNTSNGGLASLATSVKTSNLYWSTAFVDGTAYHYVLTYDGAHIYAYLNGTQVGNDTLTGAIVSSSYAINIGRGAYINDYWSGFAGHAAIYPLALSAAQAAAHYNAGLLTISNPATATISLSETTGNIGDLVRASVIFAANGGNVDPTTVRAIVKAPNGSVNTYAYGTDAALLKDGIGAYHLDVYPEFAGSWTVRFEGLGGYFAGSETTFTVKASAF